MKTYRLVLAAIAGAGLLAVQAQTNPPVSTDHTTLREALTPPAVSDRPRFIGLTITTKSPYVATNVPITAGYMKYELLQLWENNILIRLKMAESATTHDAGCLEMTIAKNPPRTCWVEALRLLLVKDRPTRSKKEDLLSNRTEWETTCEWWTPEQSVIKRMTEVGEIPLEHVRLERALTDFLTEEGTDAEAMYPRINFVGFRWLHTNNKIPDNQLFQPEKRFGHWLKQKIDGSPPNLFQVVRCADIQSDILNIRTQWSRLPVRVSPEEIVIIEIFQLPKAGVAQ